MRPLRWRERALGRAKPVHEPDVERVAVELIAVNAWREVLVHHLVVVEDLADTWMQTLGQALKLPPVAEHPPQRNRCGFEATLQNRSTSQGIRR